MGAWYTIGLFTGLGVALGVLLAGLFAGRPGRWALGVVLSVGLAAGLAYVLSGWEEAIGAGVGAVAGSFGAGQLVQGTLGRGGTRGGIALILAGGAGLLALLALIPLAGYFEAIVVPALGVRLRQRAGERYAGLRILAKD